MKEFWGTFAGQLAAALLPVALVGVVALLIWRRLFGAKTASELVGNVTAAAATIPGGLKSLIGSTVRGESVDGYISDAEQRARAAAELAARQGRL